MAETLTDVLAAGYQDVDAATQDFEVLAARVKDGGVEIEGMILGVRYGKLLGHERVLDLRDGVLRRDADWTSPAGKRVRVRSTRLVSFVQRSVAAILDEVEPVGGAARIVVQSELVANEPPPDDHDDPRAAAALRAPLVAEHFAHNRLRSRLVHRARVSGLRLGTAMDHVIEGPEGTVGGRVANGRRRVRRDARPRRQAGCSRPGRPVS